VEYRGQPENLKEKAIIEVIREFYPDIRPFGIYNILRIIKHWGVETSELRGPALSNYWEDVAIPYLNQELGWGHEDRLFSIYSRSLSPLGVST
jgi:hypothetical protein